MESLDPTFLKQLASGGVSNLLTLALFGILYVIMKKSNCKHMECRSLCFSCKSDTKSETENGDIEEEIEHRKHEEKI